MPLDLVDLRNLASMTEGLYFDVLRMSRGLEGSSCKANLGISDTGTEVGIRTVLMQFRSGKEYL